VQWYNLEHRHSGIRYVSPAQRHARLGATILAARHRLYLAAQARHPARWSGHTRNWTPCAAVTLNPERDHVVSLAAKESHTQQIAA
jgi:putative transposase